MFGKSRDGNDPVFPQVKQQPAGIAPARHHPVEGHPSNEQVSAISRGVTVVGKIYGEGTVKIFGRVEGELIATAISIHEGAQVDGDLVAEDLIIAGQVRGTVHANRVRLNSTAMVEGDIFHQTLSVEENAHFDGSSKRQNKAVDLAGISTPAAAQARNDEAVDLPRIPLRTPAVRHNLEVDVDVLEDEPKSNGQLAMADSPSLAPH
jgi:cytoskeletal protein CcmA (bactofilin family)